MDPTLRDARVIFHDAMEIASTDERLAFVARACGDDAELRREVEALLAAHDSAGSFLESPPTGLGPDPTVDRARARDAIREAPGTVIGRYKMLEQIGEGGHGVVFMAEQTTPVHRRVALKVIKPGMDTRQVIARFDAERQALALMDHPNIAKVFDAGATDSDRPYFVMELVRGVPITQYCDEHRLTPVLRLELFAQVCHAVQHAHQKGIIHRDLKPSNVLVAPHDGMSVPKVIDFGVAKATGPKLTELTMFTGFGDVVGTLEYMSPEQAELNQLDVDTRSDIYSLGVLLYELLTGTTPLERGRLKHAALIEALRVIREEDPPKPSTRLGTGGQLPSIAANRGLEPRKLSGLVHGELDWIVMKCLEKDRARRYETANGLAMDLHRYLHDEPVVAAPPSAAYRVRKSFRRHKGSVIAAGLVAAALVGGMMSTTWQAIRARQAQAAADASAMRATAVSDLLRDMLGSANPDQVKGADYTVRQLLDDASRHLRDQLQDQPQVEAALRGTIGNAYRRLGLPHAAEPHLRAAVELRRRTSPAGHPDVAESLFDHAWNRMEGGDPAGAEAEAREALAGYQGRPGQEAKAIRAFLCVELTLLRQQRNAEAARVADQALSFARSAGCGERPEVASILHNKAVAVGAAGDYAEAEAVVREAIALHRRVNGGEHPETGYAIARLGQILLEQQKLAQAEPPLREALALFRRYYGPDHKSVKNVTATLRKVLEARGDAAGVAALALEEQGHAERRRRPDPKEAGGPLERAQVLARDGRWRDAEQAADDAYAVVDRLGADARWKLGELYAQAGERRRTAGQLGRAEQLLSRGIDLSKPLVDGSPQRRPSLAAAVRNRGFALWDLGRLAEAEATLAEAAALYEAIATAAPDAPNAPAHRHFAGESFGFVGDIQAARGRTAEAEQSYRKAVAVLETVPVEFYIKPPPSRDTRSSHEDLATLLQESGRSQEARALRLQKAARAERITAARLAAQSHPSRRP